MADTRVMAKSPTQMLKQDHRTVKELFAEYAKLEAGDQEEKDRVFQEINEGLMIHSEIEERLFYPAVRDLRTEEAQEVINEALEEHKIVSMLLEEMSSLEAGDEEFEAKMTVLRENVEHHADEEEREMFPLAKKLSKDVQERLGIQMTSLRAELEDREPE